MPKMRELARASLQISQMSRRPARCTVAEIARALRAVEKTGAHVAVTILPDGTIKLLPLATVDKPVQPVDDPGVGSF